MPVPCARDGQAGALPFSRHAACRRPCTKRLPRARPPPARPAPQKYTRVPQELQYSNSDILLAADDPGREQQQQLLQRVAADEADERDWRSRSAPPPASAGAQQQQQPGKRPEGGAAAASSAAAPAPGAAAAGGEAAKIQKAADLGRTAWHAGVTAEGAEQTMRKASGPLPCVSVPVGSMLHVQRRASAPHHPVLCQHSCCAGPAGALVVPSAARRAARLLACGSLLPGAPGLICMP